MKAFTLYQIDSFTRTRFKGNPAGVIVNADGLSDEQMQAIARELNNSETAFILSPDSDDHDIHIRYFSPTIEVPICGHATIAAMHAKAVEEELSNCTLRAKTQVGVLPFKIETSSGQRKIWMTQGAISIEPALAEPAQQKLLEYLRLTPEDLDNRCPIQIASTGHSKVMIGINNKITLNQLQPSFSQLAALSDEINCNGYFVFVLDLDNPAIQSNGRMFAPAIGINEDPVTGNANGPLGAYLVHNKLVDTNADTFSFTSAQGEAIGRAGQMEVVVSIQENQAVSVSIGGEAVTVFKTTIEI